MTATRRADPRRTEPWQAVPVLSVSRPPAVVGRQAERRLDRRVAGSSGCGRLERAARSRPCRSPRASAARPVGRRRVPGHSDRQVVRCAARRSSAGALDADVASRRCASAMAARVLDLRDRLGVRRRISLAARRPAARARSADPAPHVCPGERGPQAIAGVAA